MTRRRLGRLPGRTGLLLASALPTLAVALLVCAGLVHLAPGTGSDIRELDPRLSAQSVKALQAANSGGSYWGTVIAFGRHAFHGDLGESQSLQRPVRELIAERLPITAKPLFGGILVGWAAALAMSLLNRLWGSFLPGMTRSFSALALCVPAPVIALALLARGSSPDLATFWVGTVVALIVFPRILFLTEEVLFAGFRAPHVEYARHKGLSGRRLLFAHVIWPAAPSLLAIGGSSVGVALSGVMPVEVVCDSPGLGQLAWMATQQRDLPLLFAVTILVTLVAVFASSFSDMARSHASPERC